ncbi:hypothetical protein ADU37_CDS18130 [Thermococcus sp. 2319x1]|uniref:type I-B CRISPR-associated protein Cas7/Cst2/DevR n=1 Tax=Thermococcus sp. 2319x1 TaxID=1674923 RepID=UPI00073AD7F7|nr:type I-B CRISPR-associated protein Cas7/Cst2/DevR [Thermococcus sp. 2319x1]ALV63512.1 hypothetical protein ADU37_CDS18130 [Thermococcus sp. 2319x1]
MKEKIWRLNIDGVHEAKKERDITGKDVTLYLLPKEERERRLKALLEAIMQYHGGAKLSNFFTKVYPEVMVVALLKRKIPVIGDALRVKPGYVDGKLVLDVDLLKETIETFEDNIEKLYVGLFENRFANVEELKKAFEGMKKVEVLSMRELRERIQNIELGG